MKCLVTGASGLLGRQVVRALEGAYELVPIGFRHAGEGRRSVDLRDPEAVGRLVDEVRPDIVVHGANYRDPDFCERNPKETRVLNVGSVNTLCECLPRETLLVFISSDYVFDGEHPPYSEDSARHPLNLYGRCKAEAENLVRNRGHELILRMPLLIGAGPDGNPEGFIAKTLEQVRDRSPVQLDDQAIRFPTWTNDVAAALAFLLEKDARGCFHYSAERGGTKRGFALEIASLLNLPADHITVPREPAWGAPRPFNSALSTDNIRDLGFSRFTDFADVVKKLLAIG
jgi:dTDP-4-dehydrorhamnose reductase